MSACASCGAENPEGARFCMSCGNALQRVCPSCGEPAPDEARFCMSCGSALDAPRGAALRPLRRRADSPPEERRQVTVLFADLSGYTAVAERMDPEAVKSLVDRALRRLGEEVQRFGGTVDKYIGDNVMALFGAPVAHEDDAERAVRAALAMQAAMDEINDWTPARRPVRAAGGHQHRRGAGRAPWAGDYTVTGDTVNVASRLQSAGRPGAVTVGERTMRATQQAIRYERARAARPEGQGRAGARLGGRRARGGAGRAAARRWRSRRWWAATTSWACSSRSSTGSAATASRTWSRWSGEAGVGKSRLLREFERRLDGAATPRCRPAAACPTAPASSTGRWARCCAPRPGSSTPTARTRPGRSSAAT